MSKPTLSEWLLDQVGDYGPGRESWGEKYRDAARIVAAREQAGPEVTEITAWAEEAEAAQKDPTRYQDWTSWGEKARRLRAWAAALVRLAESSAERVLWIEEQEGLRASLRESEQRAQAAEAKLKRVEGLMRSPSHDELDAPLVYVEALKSALADAGGETEVHSDPGL